MLDLCHHNTQEAVAGGSQIAEKQIVRYMDRLVYKPIIPALEQKLETEPPGVCGHSLLYNESKGSLGYMRDSSLSERGEGEGHIYTDVCTSHTYIHTHTHKIYYEPLAHVLRETDDGG